MNQCVGFESVQFQYITKIETNERKNEATIQRDVEQSHNNFKIPCTDILYI